jgi:hypothetical protein
MNGLKISKYPLINENMGTIAFNIKTNKYKVYHTFIHALKTALSKR